LTNASYSDLLLLDPIRRDPHNRIPKSNKRYIEVNLDDFLGKIISVKPLEDQDFNPLSESGLTLPMSTIPGKNLRSSYSGKSRYLAESSHGCIKPELFSSLYKIPPESLIA